MAVPLRLLLALLGGLCLWSAFPGLDLWPAAPFGVAFITLSTCGASRRAGLLLGFAAGMAYFTPLLSWSGIYVGVLPWLALAVSQSAYLAVLGAVAAHLQRPRRPATDSRLDAGDPHPFAPILTAPVRPGLIATAWVVQELARSTTPFGGFPWARLAFSQVDAPYAGAAALAGAPGVSFLVALTGTLLAAVLHAWLRASRRSAVLPAVGALVVLLAPMLVPRPTDGPTARFLGIQGDVPQAGLDFNAQRRAVLDNHARVSAQAAQDIAAGRRERPDVVIWPENASDIDPLRNKDASEVITTATDRLGVPVLLGAVLDEPVGHVSNSTLLYRPGASAPVGRYDKRHPVPFAEYIPYRSFFRFFSDKVDLVVRDFAAGTELGLFDVTSAAGTRIVMGINICFEVAYDDLVRDGVQHGANAIVVQTNNATFGRTDESVQQLAISRLRAVEHGRAVLHISNVGVSALIAPDGTMHDRTELFEPAILDEALPLLTDLTLATRLGRAPEAAASLVLLIGAVTSLRRRRG